MDKIKVPAKVPALTFTMLDKTYVDLGSDLKDALKKSRKFNPDTITANTPQFFEVIVGDRVVTFKIYKSKGVRGHVRLWLEKGLMRELHVIIGDTLNFVFSEDKKIRLEIDRTGHVSAKDSERLIWQYFASQPPDRKMKRPNGELTPLAARVVDVRYIRDRQVSDWVIHHAGGTCELCKTDGPFRDVSDRLYLEAHHIHFLSNGGPDVVENVVALCPNCHRKCHHSKDTAKIAERLSVVVASRRWV